MKKRKTKGFLAMLLALAMIITLLPAQAFATDISVAEIGSTKYESLADAIAAVPTDGTETTITMIADETVSNVGSGWISIAAAKNIVLDLNGHTVSGVSDQKSTYFIRNYGTLEIVDSGENGKITLCAVADTSYSKESVTIYNLDGKLTLTSGKIENTTPGGASYAINNSSNAWGKGDNKETVFTMNGGVVSAPQGDAALRVYQNCAQTPNPISHNTVTITGGTILDTGIFVDNNIYQANAQTTGEGILIDINISGGTINGLIDLKLRHAFNTSLEITGGDFTNAKMRVRKQTDSSHVWGVQGEPTDPIVTISGGRFSFVNAAGMFNVSSAWTATSTWSTFVPYEVTGGKFNLEPTYVAEGYEAVAIDEDPYFFEVVPAVTYVAQTGNVKYTTLAEAIAAVPTDGTATTITMIANEVLSSGVTIVAGQNIVLELNGKIVSESLSQSGTTALITNRGTLTIQDNTDTNKDGTGTGKITYFNGLPDPAAIPGYASNTIANNGTLTIESGLVENTTNGGYAAYTVDNLTNGNGYTPVFTMNGGRLYNNYTDAVRMFLNSDTKLNKVVINGGVLDSDKASGRVIVIHNPNSKVNKGELDITGGTINGKVNGWSAANAGGVEDRFSDAQYAEIAINISGGNIGALSFAEMANETLRAQALQVTGGKYKTTPSTYVTEGYEAVAIDEDPYFFEVVPAVTYVAQTGGVKYETLAAAIEAAEVGGTVTLLTDIDITSTINIAKSLTIDGNNKTINVTGGAGGYGIYIKDESTGSLTVDISNLTLNTTGYQVALMLNSDFGSKVNIENVDINCDGECIYSNGLGTVTATGCDFSHTGTYAPGKDAVYYSALIVGYGGEIIAENCTVTSFGNGAATFPSGGTITLTNTDITINEDTESETNAGYAMWSRNEDYTNYPEYCRDSVISFNSGSVYGGFKITDKYISGIKNRYDAVIVIKGGIFSEDPSAYVANGYKAVMINEDPYFFQVGVLEATATQEGSVQDNEVTFSVGSVVKDADEEVITGSAVVDQSITLTGTFENDYKEIVTDDASKTAVGAANLTQFDEAQLPDIVAAAYVEAGNQAADIKDVKIVVVSDGFTEGTSTGGLPTLTYEVHPEAITYNAGGEAINSVAIANSQLGSEAVFSIKLPVSDELYSEAVDTDGYRYVSVTHVSSDEGYEDEVGYFRIKGTAGSYYIICDVTHFSEFELEPVVVANVAGVKVQASITLQDDIKINFYVNGLDGDKYVGDYKVRYTYNGVTTEVRLDEVSPEANGYKFVVAECAARQMNDTVDFRVFYQDTEIFRTPDYSIRVYCEKQLAKSNINAKLRNICLAVLDYGAAAQNYFGYQKSNLANATYTAGTVASTVVPVYVAEATWGGAVSKVTASLSLKSRTELNFYIYSASYIDDEVTVTVGGSTWTNYTYEYLGVNDGLKIYKLTVKGIASGLLGQNVSFEILEGGIASATYSPMSYAYRNQNKGAGLGNVCKALYNYYVAASAYFN